MLYGDLHPLLQRAGVEDPLQFMPRSGMKLAGRVVAITGGGSGLGADTC
jgi:hypothetical protein